MTTKERILAIYRNQKPDKIPWAIYNRYHRIGHIERYARNQGLGILDFYPVVSLIAPPWHVKSGYVSEVKNSSFSIQLAWENGEQLEKRTFTTPAGTISQKTRKDPAYGSDWIEKHYVQSTEDLKIMQYIIENTVLKSQEKTIIQRIEDLGDDGVVLGRMDRSPFQKLLIELVNPEQFLVDVYVNPAPIDELIQVIDSRMDEQFDMALNSSVEVIWQPDNVTSDMTPPDLFSKYCLPFYQKNGNKCKEAGKLYAVHIDGRTRGIKDQIKDVPFDIIDSFSTPLIGGDITIEEALNIGPTKSFVRISLRPYACLMKKKLLCTYKTCIPHLMNVHL